jgi:hypothetical protein
LSAGRIEHPAALVGGFGVADAEGDGDAGALGEASLVVTGWMPVTGPGEAAGVSVTVDAAPHAASSERARPVAM